MFVDIVDGIVDDVVAALLRFGIAHLYGDRKCVDEIALDLVRLDVRVERRKA